MPGGEEHLARLDSLFAEMERAAPDAAFFLTADHGMHHKTRVWDLEGVRQSRAQLRAAMLPPSVTHTFSITADSAARHGSICRIRPTKRAHGKDSRCAPGVELVLRLTRAAALSFDAVTDRTARRVRRPRHGVRRTRRRRDT